MTTPRLSRDQIDYTYLLLWLQSATEGLADEARARIREEITDHFHQALDESLAAGLTQEAATRTAVEQLGDPDSARRAFRRTYLSRWQGYLLRRFIEPPRFRSPATSVILPAALTSHWDPRRERSMRPFFATLFTAMAALQLASFGRLTPLSVSLVAVMGATAGVFKFVVPWLARRGRQRDAIALGATAELCFWSAWLLVPELTHAHNLELRLWLVGAITLYFVVVYLPLLAKLANQPRRPA